MEEEEEEEEETVQTRAYSSQTGDAAPDLESRINALKGGGQPLPESVRVFFEPLFGYDFSQVRIHNDGRGNALARTVNARAYTVGRDVVFGAGQYTPGTVEGQRLLAHELTHTIQQDRNRLRNTHQGFYKYGTQNTEGSGKEYIQRKKEETSPSGYQSPKIENPPIWAPGISKSDYKAYPGQFRWRFTGSFQAKDMDKRFYIVQWMQGSVKGCGRGGTGCVYAWKYKHLDQDKVPFNFPEWVIDAPSKSSAEYVGLTKSKDDISFKDYPGTGQSPEAARKGRWPPGSVWTADISFRIQVYSRETIQEKTKATDFKSIDNPCPVLIVPWNWKDSYTIPD